MIAILTSNESADRESCFQIQRDLSRAYVAASPKCKIIEYVCSFLPNSPSGSEKEIWNAVEKIRGLRPDRLVFIDHDVNPGPLLELLSFHGIRGLTLEFHLYGGWRSQLRVPEKIENGYASMTFA